MPRSSPNTSCATTRRRSPASTCTSRPTGGDAEAINPNSGPAQQLTAYAVCQPPTGGAVGPTTVVTTTAMISPGSTTDVPIASCPPGQQVAGGGIDVVDAAVGGDSNSPSATVLRAGAAPSPTRSSVLVSVTGAICADQTGLGNINGIGGASSCATGDEAVDGGFFLQVPGSDQAPGTLLEDAPLLADGSIPTQGQGPITGWSTEPSPAANGYLTALMCVSPPPAPPTTPAKPFIRLSGSDRIATAIAVSQAAFPTAGSAGGVVLARSDIFPDALGGTPLAAAKDAPLLFTPPTSLDPVRRPRSPG